MDTRTITAEDIMTRRLAVTSPDTHVMDAIERLIAYRVSGLPVIDSNGGFAGRFSERSAIRALDLGCLQMGSRAAGALRTVKSVDLMDRFGLVLRADQDVFECATQLLERRVSGAPVVDESGCLLGVFSEQSVMHVFIGLCWEQLPSSCVSSWLDRHLDRRITEETGLDEILERFQTTAYRRLMVMHGPKLVGQVTRTDALHAALKSSREPMITSQTVAGERQMGLKTTVNAWMLKMKNCEQTSHQSDVLSISQQFLRTSARQIPVFEDERLVGQISRSDLLRAVERFFPEPSATETGAQTLYLSSVNKQNSFSPV